MSIRSYTVAFLSLFIIIFAGTGCQRKCKVCDYGTFCNNGYCFCPNGFEGDSCHTYSNLKFLNLNYIVSDPCSGNNGYSVYITGDQNYPNKLYINNLFTSFQVEADIYSNASKQGIDLVVPDQVIGAVEVSGSGIYQVYGGRARITLNLSYLTGGAGSNCTVIMNQQ